MNGFLEFQCSLRDGVLLIAEARDGSTSKVALVAKTESERLWHNRLAHANLGSIKELAKRNAVMGLDLSLPIRKVNDCEDCMRGKQAKLSLRSKAWQARKCGGIIHSDVCGMMPVPSPGGSRYYVSFIDEFSRYIIVVPMQYKSEVLEKFTQFHNWFEHKFECKIKTLHSDGGGEYVACHQYLAKFVIERKENSPYTAELNGMAERTNRTLMESARALIYHAEMSGSIWVEAVAYSADIRNRFICPRSESMTCYEILTGHKPRVNHIRVFGSLVWTHIPKQKCRKLDSRSEE